MLLQAELILPFRSGKLPPSDKTQVKFPFVQEALLDPPTLLCAPISHHHLVHITS